MERRGNSFLCSSNGAAGAGPGRAVSAGPTTARPYWKTRWRRERGHLHALLLPRDPLVPPELRAAGPAQFCLLSPWSAGGCGRAVTNHGGPHAVPCASQDGRWQAPGSRWLWPSCSHRSSLGLAGHTPVCTKILHDFQTENGGGFKEKLRRELVLCREQPQTCAAESGAAWDRGVPPAQLRGARAGR